MSININKVKTAYRWIMAAPTYKKEERPLCLLKRLGLYAPVGLRICLRYPETSKATAKQPPHDFKLTEFEKTIPFRPKSTWLYYTFFPYFFASLLFLKDRKATVKGLRGMEALVNISHEIYRQYPGKYPFGPKEARLSWWKPSDLALRLYYAADPKRNNVFPSLHVGMTAFVGLTLLHGGYERAARFMLLWSTLLSASTLPVKQHFQVDIIAAWVLATKVHQVIFMSGQIHPQASTAIEEITLRISRNLIEGDYSPVTAKRAYPWAHIHPAIQEVAEQIEELNPFDPIYAKIIQNTIDLAKRT